MLIDVDEGYIGLADAIYARRCDEHYWVKGDCPMIEEYSCGLGAPRSIPPYCTKWCELISEPTATLKSEYKKQGEQ